jgi:hypothetical protein
MAEEKIGNCADWIIFDCFGDERKFVNGFGNLVAARGFGKKVFEGADDAGRTRSVTHGTMDRLRRARIPIAAWQASIDYLMFISCFNSYLLRVLSGLA